MKGFLRRWSVSKTVLATGWAAPTKMIVVSAMTPRITTVMFCVAVTPPLANAMPPQTVRSVPVTIPAGIPPLSVHAT